jgi:pimeloyl-ACP methyl ester carboxylesterase
MGHSQGGFLSMLLATLDSRITAIVPMGVGPLSFEDERFKKFEYDSRCILDHAISKHLPKTKRRYLSGAAKDLSEQEMRKQNKGLEEYSGRLCDKTQPPVSCIKADGSGYYTIADHEYTEEDRKVAFDTGMSDHTFFGSQDPVTKTSKLLPTFKDGKQPWGMKPTLHWLAEAAKEPKNVSVPSKPAVAIKEFQATYKGGHDEEYQMKGFHPEGKGKFPVYVYLPGTGDTPGNPQDMEYVKYMAGKEFVAATIEYQNGDMCFSLCQDGGECKLSFFSMLGLGTTITTFEKARKIKNALDVLCQHENADCSKGLAVMGHSQGGFTTMVLTLLDSRITAILPMGVGPLQMPGEAVDRFRFDTKCVGNAQISKHLPQSKRRYTNGEADNLSRSNQSNDNKGLEDFSGYLCKTTETPINCMQDDGSGYYIVSATEYTDEDMKVVFDTSHHKVAGHNFFGSSDPVSEESVFLPSFKDGSAPWTMKPMLDWLAATSQLPKDEPLPSEESTAKKIKISPLPKNESHYIAKEVKEQPMKPAIADADEEVPMQHEATKSLCPRRMVGVSYVVTLGALLLSIA